MEKRFSKEVLNILSALNQSDSMEVFLHEEDTSILEVKTGVKSPYLILEIEIEDKKNLLFVGKIYDIYLIQPDLEIEQIYSRDLPNWKKGKRVEVALAPIRARGGVLKIA